VTHDLEPAARELTHVVARVDDAALDGPTPCADWTVRDLLGHLLGLTTHFATVARKQPPVEGLGALPDDWRDRITERALDLAAAWRDPEAWTGEGEAGGVRMPNAQLGVVALEEIVMHGWDLAVSVDVPYSVADADVAAIEGFVVGAQQFPPEQRAGLYGPVLDVPADATEFERLLALAGRPPRGAVPTS
jgi:uncharacterized protein (TIGR03086 family)